ncbi:hypothetical protein PV328_001173 [Microctonus aethiopoides]|uniref:Uncharacterized protein n=1 Tax=Microctonus aethiopoides TaxID=144406 RepID=A0AA39FXL7_9HYME|nr:hypothetical protein PV328_001173 [Microctonus aethiopoides]
MTSLQQKFQTLSTNCLETLDQEMMEFIRRRGGLSIYSFNDFLQQQLKSQMINDQNTLISKSGTYIDAAFSRYLGTIDPITYISNFSYHKLFVSTVVIAPATLNVQAIEAPSKIQIT